MLKAVQFHETIEYARLRLLTDSHTRIRYVDIDTIIGQTITKPYRTRAGELHGVGKEIGQNLSQTGLLRHNTIVITVRLKDNLYTRGHSQGESLLLGSEYLTQTQGRINKLHLSGLDLRDIQDITDQLQQKLIATLYDPQIFLFFLLIVTLRQ